MRLYEFASDQVTVWFNPAYKGVDLDHNYWDKKPAKQIETSKLIPNEPEVKSEPNVYHDKYKAGEDVKPIIVTKHPCVRGYLVLDGNHRYFAAKDAGVKTMEVIEVPSNVITHRGDVPKIQNENKITSSDLQQLETYADRLFASLGIDVEFSKHFQDRINDPRNKKPITMAELTRLFKQIYKQHGKPIAQLGPDAEAVMKDMRTDVNVPFALKWDGKELDLVAKTIMRKPNFNTPNPEFAVEGKRIPRKKGQPAGSKKHSDLYTDENPKGTIHGLGFKDEATARSSVSKIRKSGRSHAHKIQAAVAMEQRAKAAGKSGPAAIYRKYINSMKKKTKAKNKK